MPLIANVTAEPVNEPDRIRSQLVEQVTGTVRWRESVSLMAEEGVTLLYEIGAGKVLSGMVRRIDERLTGKALGTSVEIEAAGENPASAPAL